MYESEKCLANGTIKQLLSRFAVIGFTNIEEFAEYCAKEAGWDGIPRNIIRIAEYYGVRVIRPSLLPQKVNGYTTPDGSEIYINSLRDPDQAAFTIAHELAHQFTEHPSWPTKDLTQSETHRLINYFAASILMPRNYVIEYAKNLPLKEPSKVLVLATKFAVSYTSMEIRIRELDIDWPGITTHNNSLRARQRAVSGIDWEARGEQDFQHLMRK